MIAKKYGHWVFITFMALGMSFFMSLTMSLVLTTRSLDETLIRWPRVWMIAFLVAWPCAAVMAPIARSLTAKITR
jgi:hypothetical protein